MLTRTQAQEIWNAAWEACLATEEMRAKLEPDEGFACRPREWCFESWAQSVGLPPPPTILYPTTDGFIRKYWNAEKGEYE
jgi:hypothetical protein